MSKVKRNLKSRSNGTNIYNQNSVNNVSRYNNIKSSNRFKKSLEPNSKIIRKGGLGKMQINNRDNDSIFSDEGSTFSNMSAKTVESFDFNKKADNFFNGIPRNGDKNKNKNIINKKRKSQEPEQPSFFEQFNEMKFDNPGGPSASNKAGNYGSRVSRLERERSLALNEGFSNFDSNEDMRYGVTDDTRHINMVPHFSNGAGYGNSEFSENTRNDTIQRKVDLFTGSANNLDWRPKTERRPLFNPMVGLTNIYGSPNFTDFYQSRMVPSKYRNNEKPMQEIRVTPGLNLGYNEVNKQGYHDTYRALPRTVDQLRTLNNPKLSFKKPIIYGMKGDKRAVLPNIETRKAPTFKENDPKDLLKTSSYYKAPTLRGNFDVAQTNRSQTTKSYAGPAGYAHVTGRHRPESLLEKSKISHKQNFLHDGPRNIGRSDIGKGVAVDYNDIPALTVKDLIAMNSRIGIAGTQQHEKAPAVDFNDTPDLTLRDIHGKVKQLNPIGTQAHSKNPMIDYTDIPDLTLRDIHGKVKQLNPIGTQAHSKNPTVDYNDIPDLNMRNIHNEVKQLNPIGTQAHSKNPTVDYNDIPDLTLRDIHINKKYLGILGTQQHSKNRTVDYNDRPELTMRDIHIKKNYINPTGTQQHSKAPAQDFNDIPDLTMRDIHIKKNYVNPTGTQQHSKAPAQDFNDIPELTMRDIHIKKNYINPVGTQQHEKGGYDVAHQNIEIDPTLKDLVVKNTYIAPCGRHEHEKQRSRRDAQNMIINEIKEKLIKGRRPTTSNYDKGRTLDFTNVTLKEPIQINRELYPDMKWKSLEVRPTQNYLTLDHYEYPDYSMRNANSFLLDQLGTNPLINNTQHVNMMTDVGPNMN